MTPNQSFIAAMATIVLSLAGVGLGAYFLDRWERRQRGRSKPKP